MVGEKSHRVGLVFGGRTVEHEVSVTSARTVGRALSDGGHEVVPLAIARDGVWLPAPESAAFLAGSGRAAPAAGGSIAGSLANLLAAEVEVVFPLVHGTWGEDGSLQGLCEMLDLPYAGAGVAASAVCMDKLLAKRVLADAGVPVVEFAATSRREHEDDPEGIVRAARGLRSPLFVKPVIGGSSVGIERVQDPSALAAAVANALRFDEQVLVERGVAGRELEVAVLGGDQLEASVVGEILPGRDFYDYADKYLEDGAELIAPAELDPAVEAAVRELAVRAFAAVGGWGMARVDFFLERATGALYVNEINTLPGFTAISMYPRLWGLTGVPLADLVDRLVRLAIERQQRRRQLDEGIAAWLGELAARGIDAG